MSLRLKTILGVGLIEAVLLVILISTVVNYMRDTSYDEMEDHIASTALLFSTAAQDAVLSQDLATLNTLIDEILKNKGVMYARISDSENTTLAQGGELRYLEEEIAGGSTHINKPIKDINNNIHHSLKNIIIDDENYGNVSIGFSTRNLQNALTNITHMAISIALIEMLLVAIFSYLLGVYLTKQLKVLRNFAIRVSEGKLDESIKITSKDELADVAKAFNVMTENLSSSQQETKKYELELITLNQELEDRVRRRTLQITNKNNQLEEAYEKLQVTQEQLVHSEKLASIGQLAAGVAHEINNPVAFIRGNLQSLSRYVSSYQRVIDEHKKVIEQHQEIISSSDSQSITSLQEISDDEDIDFINEDIKTLLTESIDGTDRVSDIVKGLKVYSREQEQNTEPVDINQCIKDALSMLNNELKYKCKVIENLTEIPVINGNKGKIGQVLTNFIMNASQAIKEKGIIKISTHSKAKNIYIVIRDTGTGIDPDNVKKLFDPFFTTKPVGEGTGLGLSISEGIISEHNGKISVKSKIGKGTEFTITLPVTVSK